MLIWTSIRQSVNVAGMKTMLILAALTVLGCASDCPAPEGIFTITTATQTGGNCDGSAIEATAGGVTEVGGAAVMGCVVSTTRTDSCSADRIVRCDDTCGAELCVTTYEITQMDVSGDGTALEATWREEVRLGANGGGALFCAGTYRLRYDKL